MKKYYIIALIIILIVAVILAIYAKNQRENEQNIAETSEKNEETVNNSQNDGNIQNAENIENTENILDTENTVNSGTVQDGEENYMTGIHHAEIVVKDYGTISLELDADVAPITVANFAKLVNEGFYDGLTFHRIIDGFMIQGGDPLGNGTGGSDEEIKGEFEANGVENNISHTRGTISMARSSFFDSASSQFFIVQTDSTYLDGQYAGFGRVTSGMEIVDKICEDTQVEDNNGTVLKENQPVIERITMID